MGIAAHGQKASCPEKNDWVCGMYLPTIAEKGKLHLQLHLQLHLRLSL
jgi:hypothetical protein